MKPLAASLLALASLTVAILPLFIQRPFEAQTPGLMAIAYELRRWGPVLTVALGLLTIAFAWSAGRRARWWAKALLVLPPAVAIGAAWFTFQNPFEWIFNRLPDVRYAAVREATFVEPSDLVIAVTLDGDSAAYPIRQLAYHHMVNDRIGRTPAVVTY